MKKTVALLLVLSMVFTLCGCGKSKEAKKAEELINAIGEVTIDSKDDLDEAQDYYSGLSDKAKAEVENYSILKKAVAEYAEIEKAYQKDIDKQILCDGIWVTQEKSRMDLLQVSLDYFETNVYDFSDDWTFTETHYSASLTLDEYVYSGKYDIDTNNRQITLIYEYDDGDTETETLSYYINEFNHHLILEPDNSGNSKFVNYPSLDSVRFTW